MKYTLMFACSMLTICLSSPDVAWSHGMRFGGGSSIGHFGGSSSSYRGGFGSRRYGHFRGPGARRYFGSSTFHSSRFGHPFDCQSSQSFGSYRSFGHGVPFFSSGLSQRRFVYRERSGAAGPPPLGAAGPTPASPASRPTTPTSFYCAPHAFRYTDQQAFFFHLNFAHRVPRSRAADYCQQAENGLIFSGFYR